MTSDRRTRVKDLFTEALAMPPAERRRFLERTCGDDHEVRSEVDSLLALYEAAGHAPPGQRADRRRAAVSNSLPVLQVVQ